MPGSANTPEQGNRRMVRFLLINISLALFWYIFGAADFFVGFLVGALALSLYERDYGLRIWWTASLIIFMLWEIVLSNIKLTWWTIQPKPRFRPGIVAVPLTLNTDLEIILIVTFITLTPGMLSVDMRRTEEGEVTLFIHCFIIPVRGPDLLRQEIKDTFERRLALVTRGGRP